MRILLDTHIMIWAISAPDQLSERLRTDIRSKRNAVFFSPVSVWETAIKFALGRSNFTLRPEAMIRYAAEADFTELSVNSAAAAGVAALPRHHGDPFDRLLVAQAIEADLVLLTADAALAAYGPHVRLTR